MLSARRILSLLCRVDACMCEWMHRNTTKTCANPSCHAHMSKSGLCLRKTEPGGVDRHGKPKKSFNSRGVRRCTNTAYVPLSHSLTHSLLHSLLHPAASVAFVSLSISLLFLHRRCCVESAAVVVEVAVCVQLRRYTAMVEGLCGCHEHRSPSPSLPSPRAMASRLLHQLPGHEGAPSLK